MKCTKKSVRERMPRIMDLRSNYIYSGFVGCFNNGSETLGAVCVDYDAETGCCTGITVYGVGNAMFEGHYRGIDCVDCHDIFCDWMSGAIGRDECIGQICERVNSEFEEPHNLSGNPNSKIACIRMRRGFTQTQLAAQIGVSQQQIARWERNGGNPKINVLVKIAGILGCDINDLI